jgi:AraC family transcriptional regulator
MTEPKVSHGLSGRTVTLGPYRLTEASYSPGQRVARHEHALPSWTLVISGAVEEVFARDAICCSPGGVIVKPATADHSNHYGPAGARCLLIEACALDEFDSEMTRDLFRVPKTVRGDLVTKLAAKIYGELNARDRVSELSLGGLVIELAAASARATSPGRKVCSKAWLNSVRDQLEAEFRNPPSLAALASAHSIHPVYVCQEFRAAFGVGIGEFVRLVRFDWARQALRFGTASIAEVAFAAGFSDHAHFSRDFKRRTGMSPHSFRSHLSPLDRMRT